jgi:CYTH domain-containing protein
MALEIERKFLVRKDLWYALRKSSRTDIKQGYLSTDPEKIIRIRITDTSGFLTIKGAIKNRSRAEFEFPIPLEDALEILDQFTSSRIEKTRYKIEYEGKTWEVDEFFGDNEGLIIAEIELNSPDEPFEKPSWVGPEVTDDPRYYNAYLIEHPFLSWK